ncbi:MAG TPA: hypothetical protein VF443_08675 [Nitrospira sp.]
MVLIEGDVPPQEAGHTAVLPDWQVAPDNRTDSEDASGLFDLKVDVTLAQVIFIDLMSFAMLSLPRFRTRWFDTHVNSVPL